MEMNTLTLIPIGKLHPHPDNPRKNLGDLSELTESIRKQGVMQNLTVVPGHYLSDEEWKELAKKYREHPDEETRDLMNGKWSDEDYTVIIGHRRMAAAQAAGLKEMPCIIRNLDKRKQFEIMMEENMQRQDLTIPEQAYGFQLMFNWGYSVKDIAEKTGFSETTVNHRLQIAKLDKKTLQNRQQEDGQYMQLSIKDLYKLESIKDIQKRNEILKLAKDSSDLHNRVNNYNREIKRVETKKKVIKYLEEQGNIEPATKQVETGRYSGRYECIGKIDYETEDWKAAADNCLKKMVPKKKYWFYQGYAGIELYTPAEKKKKEETEYDRIQKKGKRLREIKKDGDKYLNSFIRDGVNGKLSGLTKEQADEIIEYCWGFIKDENVYTDIRSSAAMVLFDKKYGYHELDSQQRQEVLNVDLWAGLLIICTDHLNSREIFRYQLKYQKELGKAYMEFTDMLHEIWGFEFPDGEIRAVIDGTHELYDKESER